MKENVQMKETSKSYFSNMYFILQYYFLLSTHALSQPTMATTEGGAPAV